MGPSAQETLAPQHHKFERDDQEERQSDLVGEVFADVAVDGNGDIFLRAEVAKLNHFVSGAGELAPVAGLVGVLLDGLIFASGDEEASGAKAQGAGASDAGGASINDDLRAGQELLGGGSKQSVIEHGDDFSLSGGRGLEKNVKIGQCPEFANHKGHEGTRRKSRPMKIPSISLSAGSMKKET